MKKVSQQDIEALLELFDRSDWRELHVLGEGIDLFVSKDPNARRPDALAPGVAHATTPAAGAGSATKRGDSADHSHLTAPVPSGPAHWQTVRAPSIGTFYRAPKPGAAPFVSVGERVEAETELCIIEVMKLFTAVRAGTTGTVQRILVEDGQMVEFDQPLFVIEPVA